MTIAAVSNIITVENISFATNVTVATARVVRLTVELANKVFAISKKTLLCGRSMYFVAVIKLPGSVYQFGVTLLKITEVHDKKSALTFSCQVLYRISLIGKDAMNLLKGLKSFGALNEKYFWMIKQTPLYCVGTSLLICYKFYSEVQHYNQQIDPDQILIAKLKMSSTALDIGGVAILVLSPYYAPLAIPAYALFTAASGVSLAKYILAG